MVLRAEMSSRSMGVIKALASLSVMPWRHLTAACSMSWIWSIHWGIRAGSKLRKMSFSIRAALLAKTGALDKIVKINGVLLFRHNCLLLLCYQICMNTLAMTKLMRPAPGEGEDPGQHHILDDAVVDGGTDA